MPNVDTLSPSSGLHERQMKPVRTVMQDSSSTEQLAAAARSPYRSMQSGKASQNAPGQPPYGEGQLPAVDAQRPLQVRCNLPLQCHLNVQSSMVAASRWPGSCFFSMRSYSWSLMMDHCHWHFSKSVLDATPVDMQLYFFAL